MEITRRCLLASAGLVAFGLTGCSSPSGSTSMVEHEIGAMKYEIPSDWELTNIKDGESFTYNPPYGGTALVQLYEGYTSSGDMDYDIQTFIDTFSEGSNSVFGELEKSYLGNSIVFTSPLNTESDGDAFSGTAKLIIRGSQFYCMFVVIPDDMYQQEKDIVSAIIDSVSFEEADGELASSAEYLNCEEVKDFQDAAGDVVSACSEFVDGDYDKCKQYLSDGTLTALAAVKNITDVPEVMAEYHEQLLITADLYLDAASAMKAGMTSDDPSYRSVALENVMESMNAATDALNELTEIASEIGM